MSYGASVEVSLPARIVITRPKSSGPRALDRGRRAELVEQVPEAVDIGEPRQVAQRQRLVGQQRARHQRQRGVLGAGNGQAAGQAVAAADEDTVHRRGSIARARVAQARCAAHDPTASRLIDFNAVDSGALLL